MVKKSSVRYVCSNCGAQYAAWTGRCSQCGQWNTVQEEVQVDAVGVARSGRPLQSRSVADVVAEDDFRRISTGLADVDAILGSGLVAGSINLIAGQPGIGKSTLLLQLAYAIAAEQPVLYVSGEESAHQIGLRARRLGALRPELQLVTSNSADDIAATVLAGQYKVVIVDSIQTVGVSGIASATGTVAQITGSTQVLTSAAKASQTALILVGHVTKEGSIAGPKVLEHLVDVVLQLEGDRYGGFKILRASKNRYGSTSEAAIFEMTDKGLAIVKNPSAALLAERQVSDGSVVLATMEGTRPLLVEVQALVNKTSYGYPKRTASGIDLNRLNVLTAVLERRTKLNLADQDIYLNIVGGMQIREPAADLAICLAIGSAAKGLQLKNNAVVFGEIGLSGEVRHVPYIEKRLAEAQKLGFDSAIGPRQTGIPAKFNQFMLSVPDVRTALNQFLKS